MKSIEAIKISFLLVALTMPMFYAIGQPPVDRALERDESRQIVEAESGVFTGAVDEHSCWRNVMLSDAQHSTHSGKGAVDTKNEVGSFVEVVFDARTTGPHRISVRYTHIKPDPRPGELRVNGMVVNPLFAMPQTDALPAWKTASTMANLIAGKNVIRLSALKDGGLPNMDYVKVAEIDSRSQRDLPLVKILEVEDGVFSGTVDHHSCWQFIATTEAQHSSPTGRGFVDTKNEVGSYVEVPFETKFGGPHTVSVRYVHNKPDDRSAVLSVNGVAARPSLAFPQTGAWTAWKTVSAPVQLSTGRNVIRITALRAEGLANIDHFEFIRGQQSSAISRPFTPIKLGTIRGIAIDSKGNLYVPNANPPTLHKITPAGVATVVPSAPIVDLFAVTRAADDTLYAVDSLRRGAFRLDPNGAKPLAPPEREDLFLGPTTLVCDAEGNLYIGENDANIIRKVTPKGEVSIYAGGFKQRGNQDGKHNEARFTQPRGLAIDRNGNLYVADEGASIIRKVSTDGNVTTLAGSAGQKGIQDGNGADARFSSPKGLAVDVTGNVIVMDSDNHTIRKITPDGMVTTLAGRPGQAAFVDGSLSEARFAGPRAAVFDAAGNLFIADGDNHAIRMISPNGLVKTIIAEKPPAATSVVSKEAATAEQWGIFEASLTGPKAGNPFIDVQLTAKFVQGSREVRTTGFYDGDGVYKIRFMPDSVGVWIYETTSNRPDLHGKTGAVKVTPPTSRNRGPVRVRNTHHFAYADGTPYFQLGTTAYSWLHRSEAQQDQTLKTLAASPFNKIRMCVFPQDNADGLLQHFPYEGKPPRNWNTERFNPEFFRNLEKRVGELRDLGIEADLILFHPYDTVWGFNAMDATNDDRYVRYVAARLSAFRNVWWSMANEYDFIKEKKESDWDRIFKGVQASDPYGHLSSIHNGFQIYNHSKDWVTHASIQNGSAVLDPERAVLYRDVYRKPIVYDEVKYEGDSPRRWGQLSAEEMVMRFWNGLVAGTYVGHSEIFRGFSDRWLAGGGEMHGKSAERLAFFKKVMETGPPEGFEPIDKWQERRTGGKAGDYYLVYFGNEKPTSWQFALYKTGLADGLKFSVEVIDTWGMTIMQVAEIFEIKKRDDYVFVDRGGRSVTLPGRPYMALRIRRQQ